MIPQNQSVLIIGPNYFNFLSAVKNAFEELGWETEVVSYDTPVHPYDLTMKIRWKLSYDKAALTEKSRNAYKSFIEKRFLAYKPDLVFIMNGEILVSSTLDMFRQNRAKVALWMFDNLQKLPSAIHHIDHTDVTFCFDMEDVKQYEAMGKKAFFLPQACDTAIYKKLPHIKKDIDILFVGNLLFSKKRKEIMLSVIKSFPDKRIVVYGLYHPWYKGLVKWIFRPYKNIFKNRNLTPEEVNKMYNRARVVLNIHQEFQKNGANPRVFEISGAGAYQICDANPYLESIFTNGEIDFYRNRQDLIDLINFALKNPNDVQKKSMLAEQITLKNHTTMELIEHVLSMTHFYFSPL